jgi:hypothetical protein
MRIYGSLESWLALEVALFLPGIFGLILLAIARPLRELRLMTTDVFLQAVLYPQAGAIVGAALGVGAGAGELWAGKPDGVFIMAFGGLILPTLAGAAIGKRLRTYIREDNRLAPSSWQPDVERLSMMNQLTWQDRQSYLTRVAELTTAGHEKCAEAKKLRFGQFWQSRSRRTRWTGYFWVIFGTFVSIMGVRSVGSEWCLAALPLGGSWFGYQWVIWKFQKEMTAAVGQNLLDGAELIQKRVDKLPPSPERASLWKSVLRYAQHFWIGA